MDNRNPEFEYKEADFRFVVKEAYKLTGISIGENKQDMVYSRLARRCRALRFTTISQYCELIKSGQDSAEMVNFVNSITTNLTSFYRESHHFNHLENVLKEIIQSRSGGRLRIWSAGCSAGMEAYSIALTCKKIITNLPAWDLKILATDIDTDILTKAVKGEYREQDIETIPKDFLKKYFSVSNNDNKKTYIVSNELKKMIHFKKLNFMDKWPMKGQFDIIFCRNVLIYFDKPTQAMIFSQFYDKLKKDAYLYIGHSESIRGFEDDFEYAGQTVYRRK